MTPRIPPVFRASHLLASGLNPLQTAQSGSHTDPGRCDHHRDALHLTLGLTVAPNPARPQRWNERLSSPARAVRAVLTGAWRCSIPQSRERGPRLVPGGASSLDGSVEISRVSRAAAKPASPVASDRGRRWPAHSTGGPSRCFHAGRRCTHPKKNCLWSCRSAACRNPWAPCPHPWAPCPHPQAPCPHLGWARRRQRRPANPSERSP